MKKFFIFAVLIASCLNSYGGSYQGKVTNIFASGGKIFVLVRSGHFDNTNRCSNREDGLPVYIDPTDEYGKALLSMALVAKTTDRLVWVSTAGSCVSGPFGNTDKLGAMDLKG